MIDSHLLAFARRRLQSLEEVDRRTFPENELTAGVGPKGKRLSLADALRRPADRPWPKVLAEVKRASPSLGQLTAVEPEALAAPMVAAGIPALSVLADAIHFGGHPEHLQRIHRLFPQVPLLFKDFVCTDYQVRLAAHLGCSAVLLMCQLLEDHELEPLFQLTLELGMEPFVECHKAEEVRRALSLRPPVIAVNARDFHAVGLPVDLHTLPRLLQETELARELTAADAVVVAQSGLSNLEDIRVLDQACPGHWPDAVQIGSSLSADGGKMDWLRPLLI